MNKKDKIIGQRFGRLTVIKEVDKPKHISVDTNAKYYLCICECGKETIVQLASLKFNNTKSCGCLFQELNQERRKSNKYIIKDNYVLVIDANNNEFIVDTESYIKMLKFDRYWYMRDKIINGRFENYIETKNNNEHIKLHNFIMQPKIDEIVDHINGVPTDNRRENLRIVNTYQNAWNRVIPNNNTSGVKGVHQNNKNGKWVARIGYKGKRITLGTFDNFEDASNARKHAEKRYYGEFMRKENWN